MVPYKFSVEFVKDILNKKAKNHWIYVIVIIYIIVIGLLPRLRKVLGTFMSEFFYILKSLGKFRLHRILKQANQVIHSLFDTY